LPESAGLGQVVELGAIAGFGLFLPLGDLAVLVDLLKPGENGLILQGDQLVAAEVVGAALHIADAQVAEQGFEEGNIAEEELVLERLGAGRDDDALAGAQGRKQVGERFAGAGAGLDDQVAMLAEGALHGLGHLQLARPVLIRQGRAGQDAAGREELVQAGQSAGWCVGKRHGAGVDGRAFSILVKRQF